MRNLDLFRRPLGGNVAAAKAVGLTLAIMLVACGDDNNCHFMPLAVGLIGQTTYNLGSANQGLATPTASTVSEPSSGLAIGTLPDGSFVGYIADTGNNRVLGYKLATVNGLVATPAGQADFVLGQPDLVTSTLGTSAVKFAGPTKVSISTPDGTKLVVTDSGNSRVLIWNALPTATGTVPDVVLGQGTDPTKYFISSNSGTSSGTCVAPSVGVGDELNHPTGAMIGNGKLVVVDHNNNRALIWSSVIDPTSGNLTITSGAPANVVLGQDTFCTSTLGIYNSTTLQTEFQTPSDVWTNGSDLLISDTGNNRVLYWLGIPTTNNTSALYVVGQTLFTRNQEGASSQVMNGPVGVTADASGNFYVADTQNNRVLQFAGFPLNHGPTASAVFGQQDFTHTAYNDDDQNGTAGDQQNNQTNVFPTENTLQQPTGVFSINGVLYVSDRQNNRVIEFEAAGGVNGSQTDFCNGYNFYDSPPNPQ